MEGCAWIIEVTWGQDCISPVYEIKASCIFVIVPKVASGACCKPETCFCISALESNIIHDDVPIFFVLYLWTIAEPKEVDFGVFYMDRLLVGIIL